MWRILQQDDDPSRVDWPSALTLLTYLALAGLLIAVLFVVPFFWGGLPNRSGTP